MSEMPQVWVLPIEPFEERYTEQWLRWYPADLKRGGCDVKLIMGTQLAATERDGGEFLDPVNTWRWKGSQIERLAEAWKNGSIECGDWILSLDGWGPATTAAAYLRDTTGKNVKLAVFMHAGSYDPNDFLAHRNMRRWAMDVERGWIKSVDLLLLGSKSHQDMIQRELQIADNEMPSVAIIGNPVKQKELWEIAHPVKWTHRERLVVFPHRLAPEKQPELLNEVRRLHSMIYPDAPPTLWIKTRDVCNSKSEYYELLAKSRVALSFAKQETFGIAMQEAIALGAWAVAPNALAYPETIKDGSGSLFNSLTEAAVQVEKHLLYTGPANWDGHHEKAAVRAAQAIIRNSR